MIKFLVPNGIGDISWLLSKLDRLSYEREINLVLGVDSWKRAMPFVKMHPRIKFHSYGPFTYETLIKHQLPFNASIKKLPAGFLTYLSINQWLEEGNRIEGWLPEEPTNFHYDLNFNPMEVKKANGLLKGDIRIGIYGSCYNTLRAWDFWKEDKWFEFIKMLVKIYPEAVFHIIGASFDIDLGDKLIALLNKEKIKHSRVIGHPIEVALHVIKNMDYFFSFPSGLGVLSNVLKTPVIMFMPPKLTKMIHMFTPVEENESGVFINQLFCSPSEAFQLFKDRGLQHMEKRIEDRKPIIVEEEKIPEPIVATVLTEPMNVIKPFDKKLRK